MFADSAASRAECPAKLVHLSHIGGEDLPVLAMGTPVQAERRRVEADKRPFFQFNFGIGKSAFAKRC
jgi:hypothetical protein